MTKYISREAAVDAGYLSDWYISSVGDEPPVWTDAHIDELLNDFIVIPKDIKAADVQPVNQWISVDDRLPEATYDCLVWYSCDTAFGKCKSWGIAHCSRCDWYTKHLDGDNIVVLYWMPMPEPPQD